MGINQVPIVDQYGDINRRLAELQQQRSAPRFSLPEGIEIVTSVMSRDISAGSPAPRTASPPSLSFVVRGESLLLIRSRSGDTLRSERGQDFIKHLMQFFPALRYSETEIVLTKKDIAWLASSIGLML